MHEQQRQLLAVPSTKMTRQATPRKRQSAKHTTDECTRQLAVDHKPNLGKVNDGLNCVPDEISDETAL